MLINSWNEVFRIIHKYVFFKHYVLLEQQDVLLDVGWLNVPLMIKVIDV